MTCSGRTLAVLEAVGYRLLQREDCLTPDPVRFSSVVTTEPGSRVRMYEGARVIWIEGQWPYVLPKGKRTNGVHCFMGSNAPFASKGASFGSSKYGAAIYVKRA